MLINDIRADETLAPYLSQDCCENDVCVDFDPAVLPADFVVIKVDTFYNATVPNPGTPKSPDCLIVQRCGDDSYKIYVVELKNVRFQSVLDANDLRDKFHTCLTDFMSNRFRQYFYDLNHQFKLKLILVAGRVKPGYTMNFKLDFLLTMRPLKFADKFYGIEGENPNPLIHPC